MLEIRFIKKRNKPNIENKTKLSTMTLSSYYLLYYILCSKPHFPFSFSTVFS